MGSLNPGDTRIALHVNYRGGEPWGHWEPQGTLLAPWRAPLSSDTSRGRVETDGDALTPEEDAEVPPLEEFLQDFEDD